MNRFTETDLPVLEHRVPKKIEMSNGALEGLAASSARGPTGFVNALHRFSSE